MRPITEFEFFIILLLVAFTLIFLVAAIIELSKRIKALEDRFDPTAIEIGAFDQEDEVVITGIAASGKRYVGLPGMIATIDKTPGKESLKIWPERTPHMPEIEQGKLWFMLKNIEKITITRKSDLV